MKYSSNTPNQPMPKFGIDTQATVCFTGFKETYTIVAIDYDDKAGFSYRFAETGSDWFAEEYLEAPKLFANV